MTDAFNPEGFAKRQLDAYNARDLEAFIREYTDDVIVYRLPSAEPILVGKVAFAAHYRDNRFNLPDLHAKLVNRMVIGNKVIDHERITGVRPAPFEIAVIYEIVGTLIERVWSLAPE